VGCGVVVLDGEGKRRLGYVECGKGFVKCGVKIGGCLSDTSVETDYVLDGRSRLANVLQAAALFSPIEEGKKRKVGLAETE